MAAVPNSSNSIHLGIDSFNTPPFTTDAIIGIICKCWATEQCAYSLTSTLPLHSLPRIRRQSHNCSMEIPIAPAGFSGMQSPIPWFIAPSPLPYPHGQQ